MSRSDGRSEPLDLARGLPTTAEDVDVQRRLRTEARLTTDQYLKALLRFPPPSLEVLRQRSGPRGHEPFRL